ncbi:5,10-methylene tetrahydromethanopterin reductase [Lysinibacillus sp. BF-4]|uniref:LLM class flavin-dependent oxidoreductase n=1 Tax=Lysinibacillus sp. BF-4 TaxID=1473546 RepID=UPI000504B613|nr:LLM class flavin-dependent oxidoreductase [Lysinibacillus sp. BF-4]KFL43980.1 5,10-methylene tetrahydromethanopterin reductase [Lysinibacillus sp. BF-4]
MTKKQIHLNGFTQNSVSPHAAGLWRYPTHNGEAHGTLAYWTDLAKTLERGKFDALFLADVIGVYDVYQASNEAALAQAVQVPAHDPLLAVSAMAAATKRLGFAITASATYIPPYQLARQYSTLDHLTDGRIGWNIVTSYLESEAINLGLAGLIPHDERYERAEEYLDVVYKLWEQSWQDGAVEKTTHYSNPHKVQAIAHEGNYFTVPGVHLVEPSKQRTPLLFQAGASPRGREFAAKHAEGIFTNTQNQKNAVAELQAFIADITARLAKYGRKREDVKIIPAVVPIIGATEEEAYAKLEDYKRYVDYDGAAALLSGHSGIDFSKLDPDQYVENLPSQAMQSRLQNYTSTNPNYRWTVRDAVLYHGLTNGSEIIVGTPSQIADRLELLSQEGGADGFNIRQVVNPASFEEFVDYVVPELQKRGIYRTDYEGETLREHYLGKNQQHLKANHYGKSVRVGGEVHA